MNLHQKNSLACCSVVFATLFVLCRSVSAGQFVRVSPDLEIYYEDAGSGPAMIFIPGWTLTTDFFSRQHAHFSKRYRTISYDPRGQGRSSKTLENNHYTQHGADLKAFLDALKLRDVILIAHSYGCFDAYAYFRAFGTANAQAFICIDESPKPTVVKEGDWGVYTTFETMRLFNNDIIYHRREVMPKFAQSMVTRKLTEEETGWFVEQVMKTPNYIAVGLGLSGDFVDYTDEAKTIDSQIPVLHVLSEKEGWTVAGKMWIKKNMPRSEVVAFGLHLMFWEFPDRFNAAVDAFLERLN